MSSEKMEKTVEMEDEGKEEEKEKEEVKEEKSERKRRFGSRTTAEEVLEGIDLTGKTVLITGTTNGIGKETARLLAHKGAHVVMANRNVELSEKTKQEIQGDSEEIKIDLLELDLNSLESVKQCAQEFLKQGWPLHILILNAGIIAASEKASKDGYNTLFAVNHLGHFYLTLLLKEKLLESSPSRVVVLSSASHRQTGLNSRGTVDEKLAALIPQPDTMLPSVLQYGRSKLCNVLFGFKLHRELFEKGVVVNVVHPGNMVPTNLFHSYGIFGKIAQVFVKPFVKTLSQGTACTVYCAVHPDLNEVSGRYFESCWDDDSYVAKDFANDTELQDALWAKSLELVEKAGFEL